MRRPCRFPSSSGPHDLVDVEEAVLLEADLDERGLHAREDVVDDALVDVAGDRAPTRAFEVHLGHAVVFEHGDRLLGDVHGDEELALRRGQRRSPRRLFAAGVRAGPGALAGGRLRLTLGGRRRLVLLLLLGSLRLRRLRLLLAASSTARAAAATWAGGLLGSRRGRGLGYGRSFRLWIGCCG